MLDSNDFFAMVSGIAVLVLATGMSAVRHGGLPKWLGWVGIVHEHAVFKGLQNAFFRLFLLPDKD